MNSDRNFAEFRSFGELQTRLLLHGRDALTILESRLHDLDQVESTAYFLCCREADQNTERSNLMDQVQAKLKEYGGISTRIAKAQRDGLLH